MTSAQKLRESRKKSLIECFNKGILKKKDIINETGINIHVIHNLWIDEDIQKALKSIK